jgi:hypothetical protein
MQTVTAVQSPCIRCNAVLMQGMHHGTLAKCTAQCQYKLCDAVLIKIVQHSVHAYHALHCSAMPMLNMQDNAYAKCAPHCGRS